MSTHDSRPSSHRGQYRSNGPGLGLPMERFCGKLLHCIKSRRYPFANLDSYITAVAQLNQIKNRYNAHQQLALLPPKESPMNLYMRNVSVSQTIGPFWSDFSPNRSRVGPLFSTPKKPRNSTQPSLQNLGSISHAF